jgi:mannose-1-phosphate guanylyltransferase
MRYGVIMAGGSGTRLWPLSRSDQPKQLLKLGSGKSLLQLSYERLRGLLPREQIFVCTVAAHADAVFANLPELPRENLLGEPEGRDTVNAVGFSAAVLAKRDKEAICAVVTADHVIEPVAQFQTSLNTAFEVAAQRPLALVTFGIVPTHGHTGYGYVQRGEAIPGQTGAFRVQAFKEKPDRATADRYVETGRYYWNSGMFVWRCDTVLNELATFLPESYKGLMQIAEAWGTPEQSAVLATVYPKLKKIAVDFAIMEPAGQGKGKAHVAVVEMPVQWLDIGSWPALAETMPTDEHNNALDTKSYVFMDSDDNVVVCQNPDHLVATVGVSDMIIVVTPNATLICPKSEAQRVRDIAMKAKEKFGAKFQ